MTLRLLSAMTALCLLSACAHSARDDSPASDLDALRTSVDRDLKPRTLPNGRLFCAEEARTEGAQDDCIGDLEDHALASEGDKATARRKLHSGIDRLKAARMDCSWWQIQCRRERDRLQDGNPEK